jgi:Mrp family chromosome partitioning ATPase
MHTNFSRRSADPTDATSAAEVRPAACTAPTSGRAMLALSFTRSSGQCLLAEADDANLIARTQRPTLSSEHLETHERRGLRGSHAAVIVRRAVTCTAYRPTRPQIVAITAARSTEGQTRVARGLGRVAVMNGERVIVLDCDTYRSSNGPLTQAESRRGRIDCLHERVPLSDVIREHKSTGMDYIPGGTVEAHAIGVLISTTMARLRQTLRQDYDLVPLAALPAQAVTGCAYRRRPCRRNPALGAVARYAAQRGSACFRTPGGSARQRGWSCLDAGGRQRPCALGLR